LHINRTTGHKWKIWAYLVIILIIRYLSSDSSAIASPLVIDANAQYKFAQKLFNKEAYSSAISEFQRFIYFFPDDSRIPAAMSYMGKSYLNNGQYDDAINTFQNLIDQYDEHKKALLAFFDISECYLRLQQPQQALISLQNLIKISDDPKLADKAYYRMGWILVKIGSWQDAVNAFEMITPQLRKEKTLNNLTETLKTDKKIPLKNPQLAGFLSVIPGAGQLYCGRYKDALSAFIVNGGLIWAAVESFDNEMYSLGTTITIFGFGFYIGNIYGAITSAHKYNQIQTQKYIRQLQKQYHIGLLSPFKGDGIMLTFQYIY
jgi:tetratricopeptide (TPR) repeat protein